MRPVSVGEAGSCITEFEIGYIRSVTQRDNYKRCRVIVEYQTKERKEREMVQVWILAKKGTKQMWADTITGTLFRPDGSCRGSDKVRIVEWL